MKSVATHSVADDLGKDVCTAFLCELEFLKDQQSSSFADNETVALEIEGPRGRALVPLAAEFCTVDRDAKIVEIDPPEGLLDVNRGGTWRDRERSNDE